MATLVYLLCAGTSALCAVLLTRAYLRSRTTLLLGSALCFTGLAVNNLLLLVDETVAGRDLQYARDLTGLLSIGVLLGALIWADR